MADNSIFFRDATSEEKAKIQKFWGDSFKKRRKNNALIIIFGSIFLAIGLYLLIALGSEYLMAGLFSFVSFLVLTIALFVITQKDSRGLKDLESEKFSVCPILIKNIRFEMNYDRVGHYGYADAYDKRGQLITRNVLFPNDIAFQSEMTNTRDCNESLLIRILNKPEVFAIPLIGGDCFE